MVHVRLLEYRVPINAEEMFNLNGEDRNRFQDMFVPIAKATIAKGGALNELEMSAIVERFHRIVQLNE